MSGVDTGIMYLYTLPLRHTGGLGEKYYNMFNVQCRKHNIVLHIIFSFSVEYYFLRRIYYLFCF